MFSFYIAPSSEKNKDAVVHCRDFTAPYLDTISTGPSSVTILGDLLHFGQLFKASGNNYFAQIAHNFCKDVEIFTFANEIIFGHIL